MRDILDSASVIKTYLIGVSQAAFMQNTEKQDAVLRRFEIIGEASSRLAPETQALFSGLPFRQMRGMRNIIAHDYGDVDLDQVWRTASGDDLEVLIATLRSFFDSVEGACEI
ncbi:MAG: DUF86 domain-containing protein [Prosthecobacter sp.]|uniref:HepT-like ribonuclease domain-containing protein n=1 Tax=Prosthecobacter sp. TaxID=1965333 RepID=UPI00390261B6